jgi:hypothetical protein
MSLFMLTSFKTIAVFLDISLIIWTGLIILLSKIVGPVAFELAGLAGYLGDTVSIQRRDDVASVGQLQIPPPPRVPQPDDGFSGSWQLICASAYSIQQAPWDSRYTGAGRSGFRRIKNVP